MNQIDYFRQNILPRYEAIVIKKTEKDIKTKFNTQRLYDEANEYSKEQLVNMYLSLKKYSTEYKQTIKKSMISSMRKVDIYKSYLDLLYS